ncbi:MAG: acylphosphatase [Candidatus Omnitrophica bacterium]|nr:acylphosphatase [Candidatus Omnitrophota bacterium]
MVRAHIFYSGMVQGVGFRYTVRNYAREFNLHGWVRNLQDGRVEILAEGKQESIDDLFREVEREFASNIRKKEIDYSESLKEFVSFEIMH